VKLNYSNAVNTVLVIVYLNWWPPIYRPFYHMLYLLHGSSLLHGSYTLHYSEGSNRETHWALYFLASAFHSLNLIVKRKSPIRLDIMQVISFTFLVFPSVLYRPTFTCSFGRLIYKKSNFYSCTFAAVYFGCILLVSDASVRLVQKPSRLKDISYKERKKQTMKALERYVLASAFPESTSTPLVQVCPLQLVRRARDQLLYELRTVRRKFNHEQEDEAPCSQQPSAT